MEPLARAIEAALFAAEEPLEVATLSDLLGGIGAGEVQRALNALAEHYRTRGVHVVERGARWHFQTAPDLAHLLRRTREQTRRLSRAATEVLAIIAYHEPVSRAEIEAIRGVQTSAGTLDVLMEANWIRIAGRREAPGRPTIYAATDAFLDHFGLSTRSDLPGIAELRAAGLIDRLDETLVEDEDASARAPRAGEAVADEAGN